MFNFRLINTSQKYTVCWDDMVVTSFSFVSHSSMNSGFDTCLKRQMTDFFTRFLHFCLKKIINVHISFYFSTVYKKCMYFAIYFKTIRYCFLPITKVDFNQRFLLSIIVTFKCPICVHGTVCYSMKSSFFYITVITFTHAFSV